MKVLTKEWINDCNLCSVAYMLNDKTDKKIPFVLMNGDTDCIAKEDLHTVKTNLNITDKENSISFVLLPDVYEYYPEYSETAIEPDRASFEDDFFVQYIDKLHAISCLPQDILKLVKDKRMLALGYVESAVKKVITEYIDGKRANIFNNYDNIYKASREAECGLAACEQLKKYPDYYSLSFIFENSTILGVKTVDKDLYLTFGLNLKVILKNAEVVEEECSLVNAYIIEYELYKDGTDYELHFLILKRDENLAPHFYYATYRFKDMELQE